MTNNINEIMNNTEALEATINAIKATQEKEDIMCVCDDIVVTIPEVEKLLQNEDTKDTAMKLLAIMWKTSGEPEATAGTPEATKKPTVQEELTKANDILEKRIDILHTRLAKVAEHFLTEQVQDVIYETHKQEDFREAIEATYAKVSDLWHTLDDDQRDKMSDILHGLGVSTGMLLSEVYKAGIKTCNTHGETLESLNNFEAVDVSKVFYDALPTDRY